MLHSTKKKMVNLINKLKVVFVDKDYNILANAKLDASFTKEDGEITSRTYVKNADGSIVASIRLIDKSTNAFVTDIETQELCDLTPNTAKAVSVLVYLDGEEVDSSDVANAALSMKATMNLQFSSSAELDPMDYSGLFVPGSKEEDQPQG